MLDITLVNISFVLSIGTIFVICKLALRLGQLGQIDHRNSPYNGVSTSVIHVVVRACAA